MSSVDINWRKRIVVHKMTNSQRWLLLVLSALSLIAFYGFLTIETKGVDLLDASVKTLKYFGTMFFSPKGQASHFGTKAEGTLPLLWSALKAVGTTLALAFLTTLIGSISALFLGLLAARNLSNKITSDLIKRVVAVFRAVPTVLWVLIFAIGSGLGSVAAVIGMSFHTVGYLLKAYSESFEELDEGTIEALRATGANWFQIVFQAVIPSSITFLLSWTFIRFEINFGIAVAMGAAAGAGGIGYNLFMAAGYFYDIREIGFITYFILLIALCMEIIATRLKKQYHLQD